MGIYGALTTAVTGMNAQSFALENISGNIANSQTTGYKRMETGFLDLIPDAAVGRQKPGAVLAYSRSTNDVRGDIVTSSTGTHVALNGSGFFVVAEKTGTSDGRSTFSDASYYTRRGDFELDRDGFLHNGAGYYLKGLPIDATGNVSGSVPEMIEISNGLIPARASERVQYELNLPQVPAEDRYLPDDGSTGAQYAASATLVDNTIEGGAITLYAADGASYNVPVRWGKVEGSNEWHMFYQSQSDPSQWTALEDTFEFEGGKLARHGGAPADLTQNLVVELENFTINGEEIGTVSFDFGRGELTQYDNANGKVAVSILQQDGYPAGSFMSVAINDSGRVVASYSNGRQIELFQVVTANFNAENQLKRMDGGIYATTSASGEAIISSEGSMTGGALEASNTDISEEFTKLIVTQQAYAAGTRIVSTADEMLQEALNMMR